MKNTLALGFVLLLFSTSSQAVDVGIGAKVGLSGLGIDLSLGLTENVNLRLIAAKIDIKDQQENVTVGDPGGEGDIDANLNFDYGASAGFIDWHIFGGGFRVSAGMYKNNGAADLTGTLTSDVVIDGTTVTTADLGQISGNVSLSDSYQPYVGIGWGRGAGGDGGLSLSFDLGVALMDPSVSLAATATGAGLSQAELDNALGGMARDAEQDLKDLKYWPVLAIGLNYAF